MIGFVRRLRGLAIAPQVRADDGEVTRQERRDTMPGRVRPRVAVQQQDGRPGAAMAHTESYVADVDAVERESLEHRLKLTV